MASSLRLAFSNRVINDVCESYSGETVTLIGGGTGCPRRIRCRRSS
jgi:hypothetical protein